MNGNANMNANNLTPQNIIEWRKKLGVKRIRITPDGVRYNCANGIIPILFSNYSEYDFLLVECTQRNSGDDANMGVSVHLIKNQIGIGLFSFYILRYATVGNSFLDIGVNQITLSGWEAKPYATTNARLSASYNIFITAIYGIKF